jgi:hypothetical protein
MRFGIILASAIVASAVAACGQAAAVVPDSRNPAHCIAAFNYAAYWFNKGNRPEKVTGMMARGIFEANKINASGGSLAKAEAEGKALTQAYAKDAEKMDALFLACGSAQDADPQFKDQLPTLVATAKVMKPPYK